MSKSVIIYSILSYISFFTIIYTVSSNFALSSLFSIALYIGSAISTLGYLESTERDIKTDIKSIILYIIFSALMYGVYHASNEKLIDVNINTMTSYWVLFYIPLIFIPIYFLYLGRKYDKPSYLPILSVSIIPAIISGLIILFFEQLRIDLIKYVTDAIQINIIDALVKLKETVEFPEQYSNMLSYVTLEKDNLAKNTVYLIPTSIFSIFFVTTYMADGFKPIIKDNKIIITDFRIPDNLVWILIIGGFFLLTTNELLKYTGYNIISIFGIIYFFQGTQIFIKILNRLRVSFFIRVLIFAFMFFQFYIFAVLIVLLGLFSIWYKPKWLYEPEDTDGNDNNGDSDKKE